MKEEFYLVNIETGEYTEKVIIDIDIDIDIDNDDGNETEQGDPGGD